MAYNANIPQATDRIKDSQPALLNNFSAISTLINVNHVNFDDPSGNQGKHKFVSMPEQGSDPSTLANEAAVYSKVGAISAVTELFWRRESNGTITNMTEKLAANPGYTYLPSGILLKWGSTDATHNAQTAIPFPVSASIPVFSSTPISMQLTITGGNATGHSGGIFLTSIDSNTQFTVYNDSNTTKPFYWLAIGV